MQNSVTIKEKKDAINDLLEFSLLFTLRQKKVIKDSMDNLSDEEINGLGRLLAIEHNNRNELDQKFMNDFVNNIEKYI